MAEMGYARYPPFDKTNCRGNVPAHKNVCCFGHEIGARHIWERSMIYVVQAGEAVKIGFTANLRKRIGHIQIAQDKRVVLLRLFAGTVEDERALHSKFRQHHIRGEWFRAHPDILTGDIALDALSTVIPRKIRKTKGISCTPAIRKNMSARSKLGWEGRTLSAWRLFKFRRTMIAKHLAVFRGASWKAQQARPA